MGERRRSTPLPGGRPIPPPGGSPRRWGLFGVVAAAIGLLYAVLVPLVWSTAGDYPRDGPLALERPELADSTRLTPDALTVGAVRDLEDDEYGRCADGSELRVVGGTVRGEPYYAVYDVVDGEVCTVTIRQAVNGADYWNVASVDFTRVAKDGGAWRWVGPVKTVEELWLGGGALVAGLVLGGLLARRDVVATVLGDGPWYARWAYRALALLAALVLVVVAFDVLFAPDLLGFLVVGLVVLAWAWGLGGGTLLLAPSLTQAAPARRRSGAPTVDERVRGGIVRRRRWRRSPGRRDAPGTLPADAPSAVTPTPAEADPLLAGRPPASVPRFRVTPSAELPDFAAVGGMDDVKAELEETVGLLLAFADEAADFRITFNGILLHGPPGTGKTYLAKALAGEFGMSFVHVTASDLVSKYVGETARNVEAAFQTAAAHVPSVLFFDEFDAIGARRDDDASAEDRRAVAQLLTSLERHRALRDLVVLAATNDRERLDGAVVRAGRFDRHVRVDLPDAAGREAILRARLQGRPSDVTADLEDLVRRTSGCSAATIAALVEAASLSAFRETVTGGVQVRITSAHLIAALEARGGRDRPTVEAWDWDRVVLADDVRAELQQVQAMVEDPETARRYGVRPPSGMLLAGPPGTGKTTIARVLAAQARCSFYPVTVADLTSKWVGESEATVARLFARAREHAPSIVFLDEIDALAGARDASSSGYENRLLNQLLTEIDGLGGRGGVFVLAATNRPDTLDPALVRGGRLSRTLWIPLPDAEGRHRLLRLHSGAMPLAYDVELGVLADATDGWSGADLEALCQQAAVVAMTHASPSSRDPEAARPRARVTQADFEAALRTLQSARASVPSTSITHRDHVVPPPGLGGS